MKKDITLMKERRFSFFFTPVGTALFVISGVILIRSLSARNSYEIILSSAALLFLLVVGIIGGWKAYKLAFLEPLWKPPFPMTANAEEDWLVSGLGVSIPIFFRLHFLVRGKFFPSGAGKSGSGCYAAGVFAETSVSCGEETAGLSLDFPMSGIFHGKGYCRLRDIFGFFSFYCGVPRLQTVKVRSAPFFGKKLYINAQSGAEDNRVKQSSNVERYYMREYAPGDRFRDINWKSSSKIDMLVTRISPDNQEKVSRIDVYLRNYGPAGKPSPEALWLLDRAKARLVQFLRVFMEEQSSYIFCIRSGCQGSWEIETAEDLDIFTEELAGLSFVSSQHEAAPTGVNPGKLYVFSTACDITLSGFLAACYPRPISLFLAQPAASIEKSGELSPQTAVLYKRDFPAKGIYPHPVWLLREKIKPLGVTANKVEMIYAETKL